MTLKLEQKKAIVAEVADIANQAVSVVAVDYRGLPVSDMIKLRSDARKADVHVQIVRNTLAIRAFKGTSFECMETALIGPVLLAFAKTELSASARLIKDFKKTNDKVEVKALSLGGKLFGKEHLDAIAKLPTRDEAISQLMSVMQAPIAKFVRTVAAPHTKLVRTIAAVRDQKQATA